MLLPATPSDEWGMKEAILYIQVAHLVNEHNWTFDDAIYHLGVNKASRDRFTTWGVQL